ncbi:hypothetical protein Ddye_026865 [Dipteronia dyeriana]|uniref:RING-type domain-containing protein n=1 Tax=Dipteronia dyeriana TaxID=168575 RepID=A0AAD9TP11_9ROSI|nr:hypothetical protein Ddye_026865 [Dipteronia dyeriana]
MNSCRNTPILFASRRVYLVAHILAKTALSIDDDMFWLEAVPPCVEMLVQALWLCVSIYYYIIEVLVWFWLERHTRSSPGNLFDIMIPNPDLQLRMKLVVTETGVWFSGLLDRFKGVSDDQQSKQELPVPIPAINYRSGEMESISTDCAICLDDFVDGDSCRILIVCNHIFHLNCIDQWLKYQLTCPICRKPVDM